MLFIINYMHFHLASFQCTFYHTCTHTHAHTQTHTHTHIYIYCLKILMESIVGAVNIICLDMFYNLASVVLHRIKEH